MDMVIIQGTAQATYLLSSNIAAMRCDRHMWTRTAHKAKPDPAVLATQLLLSRLTGIQLSLLPLHLTPHPEPSEMTHATAPPNEFICILRHESTEHLKRSQRCVIHRRSDPRPNAFAQDGTVGARKQHTDPAGRFHAHPLVAARTAFARPRTPSSAKPT